MEIDFFPFFVTRLAQLTVQEFTSWISFSLNPLHIEVGRFYLFTAQYFSCFCSVVMTQFSLSVYFFISLVRAFLLTAFFPMCISLKAFSILNFFLVVRDKREHNITLTWAPLGWNGSCSSCRKFFQTVSWLKEELLKAFLMSKIVQYAVGDFLVDTISPIHPKNSTMVVF